MKQVIIMIALFILWSMPSHAFMQEESTVTIETFSSEATLGNNPEALKEALVRSIPQFVDTPNGFVSWTQFAETKEIPYQYQTLDGYEGSGLRPEFTDDLTIFDGKNINLKGFMFPLEQSEAQSLFLIGPFPLGCPFHYHVTTSMIVEVKASKPIPFSYDPIAIHGRLELVPRDDEYNVFYRLHDAKLVD